MARSRVTERDHGAAKVVKAVEGQMSVKVGIMSDKGSAPKKGGTAGAPTGNTVLDVANQHEFGIGVPRRSFVGQFNDENEAELFKWLELVSKQVAESKITKRAGAGQFGSKVANENKDWMSRGPAGWQPLSQAYADKHHGGDRTARLILWGQLRSSITHQVEEA
ncbi:hypothetical protein KKD03_05640 [Patescibacteria group bacterium]|nr:hypothetical protein [Patescibacteria group bacterium]